MNYIKKDYKKPDIELIEKFKSLPTPAISDVMGRHSCMSNRIRPVYKEARVVGPALTVRAYPSDNLMIHVGLKMAVAGDILVVDAGGYSNVGLWGEVMTICAQTKGVKGLVIDGGIRDCKELEELDFPTFSAGINARGGFKSDPGSVNCPISCGDVVVNPGDIIVADENGIVVVPLDNAVEIYEKAVLRVQSEEIIKEQLRQGIEIFDILELDKQLAELHIIEL